MHTAGVRVYEHSCCDFNSGEHVLWRVQDDLTGEALTLTAEQWVALTSSWADAVEPPPRGAALH